MVILALLREAQERIIDSVSTSIYRVMEQGTLKFFSTENADELVTEKIRKRVESQDITKELVRHLIKSSTFTIQIVYFAEQQAKKAVYSKVKCRQEKIRKVMAQE